MIRLTPKEVEALQLSALGLTGKQVARRLGICSATANGRGSRCLEKLGVQTRAHAVAVLIGAGVIEAPERVEVEVVAPSQRSGRTLVDFVEDYKILRNRGMSRRDIAKKMDLKISTVETYVGRARKAGLLPPYRPGEPS